MITTVDQTYTVMLPAEMRQRYGIKPGDRLDWQFIDGKDASWFECSQSGPNWRGNP
jgi:AbrB family looped-hinge helix DNA binding protein